MRGLAPAILTGVGVIHCAVGIVEGRSTLGAMIRLGWWDSVGAGSASLLLWFMSAGIFLILFGLLGWWVERHLNQALPAPLGWAVLAYAVVAGSAAGNLVFPVPVFLLAAVLIVARARRGAPPAAPAQ